MLPFLEGTEPTRLCPLHSGEAPLATTVAAAGAPGGATDTEAANGAGSAIPPAPPAGTGTASNNVFGAVGSFFGSLFGHH